MRNLQINSSRTLAGQVGRMAAYVDLFADEMLSDGYRSQGSVENWIQDWRLTKFVSLALDLSDEPQRPASSDIRSLVASDVHESLDASLRALLAKGSSPTDTIVASAYAMGRLATDLCRYLPRYVQYTLEFPNDRSDSTDTGEPHDRIAPSFLVRPPQAFLAELGCSKHMIQAAITSENRWYQYAAAQTFYLTTAAMLASSPTANHETSRNEFANLMSDLASHCVDPVLSQLIDERVSRLTVHGHSIRGQREHLPSRSISSRHLNSL